MRVLRRQWQWGSLHGRLGAGVTLVAFLLTAFGVPMPASAPNAVKPCGCATADNCRGGSCCCSRRGGVSESDGDSTARGVSWVSGIAAMTCKGLSTLWVSTGVLLLPPAPPIDRPILDPASWVRCFDEIAKATRASPPNPPPR